MDLRLFFLAILYLQSEPIALLACAKMGNTKTINLQCNAPLTQTLMCTHTQTDTMLSCVNEYHKNNDMHAKSNTEHKPKTLFRKKQHSIVIVT